MYWLYPLAQWIHELISECLEVLCWDEPTWHISFVQRYPTAAYHSVRIYWHWLMNIAVLFWWLNCQCWTVFWESFNILACLEYQPRFTSKTCVLQHCRISMCYSCWSTGSCNVFLYSCTRLSFSYFRMGFMLDLASTRSVILFVTCSSSFATVCIVTWASGSTVA